MGERNSRKHHPRKRKRGSNSGVDWFSILPDHTIASILSCLPLKDAVRTSVLSHRWEKLWRYRFGSDIILCYDASFYDSSHDFVKWVNRILQSSENQPVNEFAIRFRVYSLYSESVKSWIAFALKKNVSRLHLDMNMVDSVLDSHCAFPDVRELSNLPAIYSNLKDVYLSGFVIRRVLFQHFLSKCPSLERLSLLRIHGLTRLKALSQTLKHLTVIRCSKLKVVVSAPNLVSMNYWGTKNNLEMGSNIGSLVEFSIACCTEDYVEEFARKFSYATQLTTLKLELSIEMVEKSISYPQDINAFTELKHLIIKMDVDDHHSLLWLICLIKAAPLLQKFEVKMRSWQNSEEQWNTKHRSPEWQKVWEEPARYTWDEQKAKTGSHKSLKVGEFHGFGNLVNQWELVKHTVEIAETLEELILDIDVSRTSSRANMYMSDAKAIGEKLVAPPTKLVLRNSTHLPPFLAAFAKICHTVSDI